MKSNVLFVTDFAWYQKLFASHQYNH